MYSFVCGCVYIRIHTYMHACIHTYLHINACIYIYVCVYIYIYMYTHTHMILLNLSFRTAWVVRIGSFLCRSDQSPGVMCAENVQEKGSTECCLGWCYRHTKNGDYNRSNRDNRSGNIGRCTSETTPDTINWP